MKIIRTLTAVLLTGTVASYAAEKKPPTEEQPKAAGTKSVADQLKLTAPTLVSVRLNKGEELVTVATVLMRWEAAGGAATSFRTSESPTFGGALWRAVDTSINNGTTGSHRLGNLVEGTKTVYVQLQNDAGSSNILSSQFEYRKPVAAVKLSSVSINNGSALSQTPTVTMHHSASGIPTHYRACDYCNAQILASKPWVTYSTSPQFTLSPGDGSKTVYFQLKGAGIPSSDGGTILNESEVLTDSIDFYLGERCFGAVGMECAVAYCAGALCKINAGSWEHDVCCWAEKISGSGKSCISFVPGVPSEVCSDSWSKAWNRITFEMSWERVLNTSERDQDGKVTFASYCAPSGSRVHDDDAQYCCSGTAVQPSLPDRNPNARICT